ncbi:unnamed protein product [Blepharisma stoltei]|uniref:Lysozyme n=1 Tax=Blepharisma stoltei TaxID=1481888 RepID=A0AAU9IE58_9CILI|nr:unnamed protein product [Blepharisma stoltei]
MNILKLITFFLSSQIYGIFDFLEIDTSALTSQSSFECLIKQGYSGTILRGYTSYGAVDPNVVSSMKNALAAGMYLVDVYMFPCVPCGNPSGQVQELWDAISSLVPLHRSLNIWVQVTQYAWNKSQSYNQSFILSMMSKISQTGNIPGVYTSILDWNAIVGASWTGAKNFFLWNIQHDDKPNTNSWQPFGGFTTVTLKQYTGTINLCNTTVNKDYYPLDS